MILYACSTNPGKLAEFALASRESDPIDLEIQPFSRREIPAPEETGDSFEANAREKALYYSGFTSAPVFADDSGLEVDALNGEPGIYSARYAGVGATDGANNERLLTRLGAATNRAAQFVCVIAVARGGKLLDVFRGEVQGEILPAPRGAQGFGYDPLFYHSVSRCSFGELAPTEKFRVSHRGNALRAMFRWISAEMNRPEASLRG